MATTQHRPHGAFAGPVFGTLDGKTEDTTPTVVVKTQHRPHGAFAGPRYGTLSGKSAASGAPVITSFTPVSGTELAVAWTGAATQYRLDGGTATALPDGTSPDTITGLTPATTYSIELRDGAGAWSASESATTDTVGGGGGDLFEVADTTHAHTADSLVLTLGYSLAIQDATHGHAADSLGLSSSGASSLTVNDATHAHTADGLVLSVLTSDLTISDATHVHRADAVTLVQAGPRVNSAPPSGHGPKLGRRGIVTASGRRGSFSTRTR